MNFQTNLTIGELKKRTEEFQNIFSIQTPSELLKIKMEDKNE